MGFSSVKDLSWGKGYPMELYLNQNLTTGLARFLDGHLNRLSIPEFFFLTLCLSHRIIFNVYGRHSIFSA